MRNFHKLCEGVPVFSALHQIQKAPQLWGQNNFRTSYENTPHVDVDDIWIRFSALEKCYDPKVIGEVIEDQAPVWYPAKHVLTEIKTLVLNLGRVVDAYEVGRVLVTRIKPGGRILPHADTDGAYVNAGDIARYHIVLQGLPGSIFRCGEEQVQMLTGEVWWFKADEVHEVLNSSADDRIHLIADFRCW